MELCNLVVIEQTAIDHCLVCPHLFMLLMDGYFWQFW